MKIILKSLLILLIMWSVYAQSQNPVMSPYKGTKPEQSQANTSHKQTDADKQGAPNRLVLIKKAPPIDINKKPTNVTEKSNNKSTPDYIPLFTGLLVLVGFLQLGVFSLQAHRLRQSIDEMKKAAEAAQKSADFLPTVERAYVFVTIKAEEMKFIDQFAGEPIYDFRITIMMWNYGKTPAVINRILKKIYFDEPLIPDTEGPEVPSGIVLGTGNNGSVPIPHYEEIDETKRKGIIICDIIPYCCGRIEYEDIFGNSHFTDFCWEFSSSTFCDIHVPGGGKWNASRKYKEMNKRT